MKANQVVRMSAIAMVLAFAVTDARAQARPVDWKHGTTLSGFLGAVSASSETSVAYGAGLGWEFTPRFAVEGRGFWLDAGRDADAFAALLGARFSPAAGRAADPFVSAGVGLYRAAFGSAGHMPPFYERRMQAHRDGVFDDFALTFGGGADIFLARHVALRPDLTVFVVTTRSDVRVVPVYGVQLAYHFEPHSFALVRR